jgi:hypothetical protein
VVFHESSAQKFFMQAQSGKRFHAERQQRFTDVKTRKFFLFENNQPAPGACEQRRGSAAGRSSPMIATSYIASFIVCSC